jgi:hypothetical protein
MKCGNTLKTTSWHQPRLSPHLAAPLQSVYPKTRRNIQKHKQDIRNGHLVSQACGSTETTVGESHECSGCVVVQDSKIPQIYLFHVLGTSEHQHLESAWSRLHDCHKMTTLHVNTASYFMQLISNTTDTWFIFPNTAQLTPKTRYLGMNLEFSLDQFYPALGALFAFWEADFHKTKGRETLSRSLMATRDR